MSRQAIKRVAPYIRVSTENQETSLETQQIRLEAAVRARSGPHEIVDWYVDDGFSGGSMERPQLQRLLSAIRQGRVDTVVVVRLDRFTRSLPDFFTLHDLLEEHDVELVSLNESFDTSTPFGKAMLRILLVFGQFEREQTADRTRQANAARAAKGLWVAGRTPHGYRTEKSGVLVPVSEEAKVVVLAFETYLRLRSRRRVASHLNELGYRLRPSRSRRLAKKKGSEFNQATVGRMLTNAVYLGKIPYKGEFFDGQHPALIDEAVFSAAQRVLEENFRKRRGASEAKAHEFLLTGLLSCSCGYAYTSSAGTGRHGGQYFYYRCGGGTKRAAHRCPIRQVRADQLEEQVVAMVREAVRNPIVIEQAVEATNKHTRSQVGPVQERLAYLRKQRLWAAQQAERMLDSLMKAGVEASRTAQQRLAQLETEQEQLGAAILKAEQELEHHESSYIDTDAIVDALRGFDAAWDGLTFVQRRELLSLLIKEIRVTEDRLVVNFYDGWMALDALAEVERRQGQPLASTETPDPPCCETVGLGFADEVAWLRQQDSNL